MSRNKDDVLIKKNYYFILNILIAIIPIIYEIFIPLFGQFLQLQIKDENGNLTDTMPGIIVKICVNVIVIIAIIWYNIASEHKGYTIKKSELDRLIIEKEGLKGSNQLFSKILHSTYKICSSKYDTLLSMIKTSKTQDLSSIQIISDPRKQIKSIIENMISCVARVTGLEESSLRTRVVYRLKDDQWEWLTGYASSGYFNIQNLINTKNSTFNCITRTDSLRENFIFFNRKSVAVQKGKYVYEPIRDFDGDSFSEADSITDGSILAKSLFIGDNYTSAFAEMLIFIDTTDDCLFLKDESKENVRKVKNLLKNEIFTNFEERLKIELALLYINYKKSKNKY